jgi:integrase
MRECYVKVYDRTETARFALDCPQHGPHGWQTWIDANRAERKAQQRTVHAGTFAADARTYLARVAGEKKRQREAQLLQRWIDAGFGCRSRHSITAQEIEAMLDQWAIRRPEVYVVTDAGERRLQDGWKPTGYSAGQRTKLRQVLVRLWTKLEGKDSPNPWRLVPKPKDAGRPESRWFSTELLHAILAELRDGGENKIRLTLMAAFALRQSEVERLEPTDFDFAGRRSGGGGVPTLLIRRPAGSKEGIVRELPMDAFGEAAARAFLAAGLCGETFSRSSMWKAWRRAVAKVMAKGHAVPSGGKLRPYDLRHKRLSDLRRTGTDLADVGHYAGHAVGSPVTARYAQIVQDKLIAAVQRAQPVTAGECSQERDRNGANPVRLTIETRAPSKYLLLDRETGEAWEWNGDAASPGWRPIARKAEA